MAELLDKGIKIIKEIGQNWRKRQRETDIADELLLKLRGMQNRIELGCGQMIGNQEVWRTATPSQGYLEILKEFNRIAVAEGLNRGRIIQQIVRRTGYGRVSTEEAELGFLVFQEQLETEIQNMPFLLATHFIEKKETPKGQKDSSSCNILLKIPRALRTPYNARVGQ